MTKSILKKSLGGISMALWIFPVSIAMGMCSGLGMGAGVVAAVVASLFSAFMGGKAIAPSYLVFFIFMLTCFGCGSALAFWALFMAGITVALVPRFFDRAIKKYKNDFLSAGILLSVAFCMTAMLTTDYFGIGAEGDSVTSIIADYVSLGFHGNWRGVLYGTVTLVIMITYPRKFKQFKKKLPAPFAAILVTLPLNLWLNPSAATTAIDEIGGYSFSPAQIFSGIFFSHGEIRNIPLALAAAVSMAIIIACENEKADSKSCLPGACNAVCAFAGGLPVTLCDIDCKSKLSAAVSAVTCAALFAARPLIMRIPLPTLAVILIIIAWQSVDWHRIKLSLTGGGVPALMFIVAAVLPAVIGMPYSVLIAAALGVLSYSFGRKS